MSDLSSALTRAAGATRRPPATTTSRQGKKGLLLHLSPAVHKRLKLLAAEHDTTMEALGLEALDLLFERYGD